ncbi:histone-lysine N-methyltransferase SETMAR [Trichonephila clavipes]|nr:histone-lysine N-methyltransferase SETMAR [Trichonephila clavipes]
MKVVKALDRLNFYTTVGDISYLHIHNMGYDPRTQNQVHGYCSTQFSPSYCQYHQTVPGKKGLVKIQLPPFKNRSPDLNPPDFFLLSRLEFALKGKRSDDIPDVQRNGTRLLNSLLKEDFLQSFQDMHSRSQRCIVLGSDYFEGQ